MMVKYNLLWIVLWFSFNSQIIAQELYHYATEVENNSINLYTDCDDENCYVSMYQFIDDHKYTTIVKIDHFGNEIERIENISFGQYDIGAISHLYIYDDDLIIFTNAKDDNKEKFITFSMSKFFDSFELISEINLEDELLVSPGYSFSNSEYESVGVTASIIDDQFYSHFYINIGEDGLINQYEKINISDNVSPVTAFTRLDQNRIYVSFFNANNVVIDNEFNILNDGILNYSLVIDGIPGVSFLGTYFAESYNNKLVIAGTGSANSESSSAIAIIDLEEGSIVVDTVIPLMDDGVMDDIVSVDATLDDMNNLIVSSVGYFNIFNPSPMQNTLYIDKFDESLSKLWSLDIKTDYQLVSYNVHANNEGLIYVIGSYMGTDFIGFRRNFLIVISEDGDIISSNLEVSLFDQVTVYPNPTSGEVYIEGIENLDTPYSIYNIDSKLVSSGKLNEISLRGYPKGIYTLRFDGISKRIVLQ